MKKNQLGSSDLYISEISLGCMSLGTNEDQAINIIHEAMDQGINYLDTADLYDFGLNEEFVGKAIKGKRDQVIIGTKVGNHWEEGREKWFWDPSKAYIKDQVKNSLRRLQTDYIDLYQLHGGTIDDPIDEVIEAFEELKTEGFIRHYGISSIRPNVIREYVKRSNIVSVMMQYNLLDRRPEEILPLLKEHKVSAIARGPVAKGLLSPKWNQKLSDKGFLSYTKSELETTIKKIDQVSGQPLNETALQYVLKNPTVATAIPGASRIEQLHENLQAANVSELTDDQYEKLQSITKAIEYEAHR